MWIATAEQSRTIDRRASEEFGLSSAVLMERAGIAVFETVKSLLPEGGRITVFCGRGNNGGDGFVVARLAKDAGYGVECLVAADEPDLRPDAANQMRIAHAQDVPIVFYSDARWLRRTECLGCRDLIVDGLLGTGAHNAVKGPIKEAIQAINRSGVPVVAIDIPSGIHADTGEELGESIWALRTVTIGLPKPFLFEGIGLEHAGYWTVEDIGFPNALLHAPTGARLIEGDWVASMLPERMRASHKGDNGSLLIVAGSAGMRGAAVLAARAALRAGIGLVTVASLPVVCDAVAAALPEALLLPIDELNRRSAEQIFRFGRTFDAAVFGPGLTHEPHVLDFLDEIWRNWTVPCVVDADGLNAVVDGLALPPGDCVLTPHPGEMSRLLHLSTAEVQHDRFHSVNLATHQYEKTVLLKGPYTLIGENAQPTLVNTTGNPGQASGGMGDVLSGVIGTLLAQDVDAYHAAAFAAHWHGRAADDCAQEFGMIGYRASEVADALPKVRARMISACSAHPH
jgi:NAD(P)H-hydrate epimerase